jgi:predicted Zn-ribbon and HTH transcriptional regulator
MIQSCTDCGYEFDDEFDDEDSELCETCRDYMDETLFDEELDEGGEG